MTGMTDIHRHGGDKKYRDDYGIKVKDDALVDPQLLGVTADSPAQTGNLVDDTDDDDGYEVGDSGPGMAAKVTRAGARLLFFPLILAYKAVVSLKHLPWLCGQIWRGVKNIPALPRQAAKFFRWLFSGRVGKVLVVIGTLTGVIWVSRKIRALTLRKASDSGLQASGSVSNVNSKTQNSKSEAQSPKPEVRHKTTATVQFTPSQQQQQPSAVANNKPPKPATQTDVAEPKEQKSRRKLGFGQLSKLASAFKRSEPVALPDAATPKEDSYDPFEASGNRWGMAKTVVFAAACLMLLVGGVTVARQAMQKNSKDIAANVPDEGTPGDPSGQDAKTSKPDPGTQKLEPNQQTPNATGMGGFPWLQQSAASSSVGTNTDVPVFTMPPAPVMGNGMGNGFSGNMVAQANNDTKVSFSSNDSSVPRGFDDLGGYSANAPLPAVAGGMQTWQENAVPEDADDYKEEGTHEVLIADNRLNPAVHASLSTAVNDRITMQESLMSASPLTGNRGDFGLTSTTGDLPVVTAQTVPPENPSSLFPLTATPRVTQDHGITMTQPDQFVAAQPATPSAMFDLSSNAREPVRETAAPLAEVLRTPQTSVANNNTSNNIANNGSGFGLMATGSTPLAATSSGSTGMINNQYDQNEQDGWDAMDAMPASQPAPYNGAIASAAPLQVQPLAAAQSEVMPQSQPLSQSRSQPQTQSPSNGMFELSPNTSQLQPATQFAQVEPVVTPVALARQPITMPTVASTVPPRVLEPGQSQNVASNNVPTTAPSTLSLPVMAQDGIGGIVSPSPHIATTPIVSPDTQASVAASYSPPIVRNANPVPPYSAQPQPLAVTQTVPQQQQWVPPAQQFASQTMPVTQPVSFGQNSVYIVQPGDNIYKIAKQELGSVRRFREIYDLNRDRLPIGQDTLTAGMELLLPNM